MNFGWIITCLVESLHDSSWLPDFVCENDNMTLLQTSWVVELQDKDFRCLLEHDESVINLYGKHLFSTGTGLSQPLFLQWIIKRAHFCCGEGVRLKSRACFLRLIQTTTYNTMPEKIHVWYIFPHFVDFDGFHVRKDIIHESYTDSMNNTFTHKRIHAC